MRIPEAPGHGIEFGERELSSAALPPVGEVRIAVVGLGYVGLPLAMAFGSKYETVGFDIDSKRVAALGEGIDKTLEVDSEELAQAERLRFTDRSSELEAVNVFVVTVPTPIDTHKNPDLGALQAASRTVGEALTSGCVVVYESTVFPGATEEVCVPILESESGLKMNRDFYVGYSPERINPGDRAHRLPDIVKVTSGSTPSAADFVDDLYGSIIRAGTHKASSIRVDEAAKVIENTQRDLNIALINELALIFDKLNLDTAEVLEAAGTKWNFLNFKPGLVGGHCIGVDPYYLTFKAQEVGHLPEVILAGRRINDAMGSKIATRLVRMMIKAGINIVGSRVLVLGLAFKENCPDLRNSRVIDVIEGLQDFDVQVDVYDPWVDPVAAKAVCGVDVVTDLAEGIYDAGVLAVAHDEFVNMGVHGIKRCMKSTHVVFDVKSVLPADAVEGRL